MQTKWVAFSATVPEWAMTELSQHVADVTARATADEEDARKPLDQRVGEALTLVRTKGGWFFVETLTHLSTQSRDGWVTWSALCDTMSMKTPMLSGVVGALDRTLRPNHPLYERRTVAGKAQFRMSPEVAKIVLDAIAENTDWSVNTDDPGVTF